MLKGKVRWFDPDKGYGMIQADDDHRSVFVHFTAIDGEGRNSVGPDDRVEFELLEAPHGPRAIKVRKIPSENAIGS